MTNKDVTTDCGEYRQAAEAVAQAVKREAEEYLLRQIALGNKFPARLVLLR